MRREEGDGAQVQPALRQGREDGRELARRSRGVDALEGGLITQVQFAHAVGVHRGIARRQVELASVELRNVREKLNNKNTLLNSATCDPQLKGAICEMGT